MSDINYEEDQRKDLDSINESDKLSDQVVKLTNLEDELANKETELKELKRKVELVSGEVIPTMMQEMNITKLKLKDGASIEVSAFYNARITPEKQEEAFNWLREHGLGDIIKNDVTVTFGMSEDNKAMAYATLAKGQGYEPVQKVAVHTGTLKAVVRERTESGQDMPADLFNTFVGNQTKINRRN